MFVLGAEGMIAMNRTVARVAVEPDRRACWEGCGGEEADTSMCACVCMHSVWQAEARKGGCACNTTPPHSRKTNTSRDQF